MRRGHGRAFCNFGFRSPDHRFDLPSLADFQGVRRRQDVLYSDDSWTIVEDFAHHPTAVAGAIGRHVLPTRS